MIEPLTESEMLKPLEVGKKINELIEWANRLDQDIQNGVIYNHRGETLGTLKQ